jgi:putative membrane protein
MMRQLNFLLIFLVCLAIALFSIENVQTTPIHIVPDVEVDAPLAIELLVALGVGAAIAWMFGLWNRLQQQLAYRKVAKEVKEQSAQIEALQTQLASYQAEKEEQKLLPEAEKDEASS